MRKRIDTSGVVPPTKPLELEMRLRNNALKSRRLQLKLSAPEFAEKVGVLYTAYIRLENLKESPYAKNGSLKKVPTRLCEFYRVLPEDLFPPDVRAVKNPVQYVSVSAQDMAVLLGPARDPEELLIEAEERQKLLPAMLESLSPTRAEVLRRKFGLDDGREQTLDEIAEDMFRSRERVRQIAIEALDELKSLSDVSVLDLEVPDLCAKIDRYARTGHGITFEMIRVSNNLKLRLINDGIVETRPSDEKGGPVFVFLTEKGQRIADACRRAKGSAT